MFLSDEEVHFYRHLILTNKEKAIFHLTLLAGRDREHFRELCHRLLVNAPEPVQGAISMLLEQWDDADESKANQVAQEPIPPSPEEGEHYQHLILTQSDLASERLRQLDKKAHQRFVALCHHLLEEKSLLVQETAFVLVGQRGDQNDSVTEAAARKALAIPQLHDSAAFALEMIGSSSPATIQTLFQYAQQGSPTAFAALLRRVATEEDKLRLLRLARQSLLSPTSYLREQALYALIRLSNAAAEEASLLQVARLYYDELVLDALGEATEAVLPELRALLKTVPADTAQHRDIKTAIEKIEHRLSLNEKGMANDAAENRGSGSGGDLCLSEKT